MKHLRRFSFSSTTLQLTLFVAILLGLGFSRQMLVVDFFSIAMMAILCTAFLLKRGVLLLIGLILLGFYIGAWRGQQFAQSTYPLTKHYREIISLRLNANTDAVYGYNKQLSFDADNIRLPDGQSIPGKIKVSGFGTNTILAGNEVVATAKLHPSNGQYVAKMSYAKLELVSAETTVVDSVRRKFVAGMETALPEPEASFAMGILVGQRANLPEEIKQAFLMVGLTHIVAVSGYNLTIIINAVQKMLSNQSRRMSVIAIIIGASFFVILAGGSASIVRAYIVSMLSLIALYYGRRIEPLNLLILTACITAYINPRNIWSDLGWYLSFLAFFGVLILAPKLKGLLNPSVANSLVIGIAIESICAEIICLPLILHIFGQMSFVGLLANVLVVSIVPLAMLLSFIAGLAGMLSIALVGWIALPAKYVLQYILGVATNLAGLPNIFNDDITISQTAMLVGYALIVIVSLGKKIGYKQQKDGIITDKNERTQ